MDWKDAPLETTAAKGTGEVTVRLTVDDAQATENILTSVVKEGVDWATEALAVGVILKLRAAIKEAEANG